MSRFSIDRESNVRTLHRRRALDVTGHRADLLRPLAALGVLALHAGAASVVILDSHQDRASAPSDDLVVITIPPRIAVSASAAKPAEPIRVPRRAPIRSVVDVPVSLRPVLAVVGVGMLPPRADDPSPSTTPFAREAGLSPGVSATVVLRVEVLGTGSVGEIAVDVSGGTAAIDRAAIHCARSIAWRGGMIDGSPATIWIRWGVTLVG